MLINITTQKKNKKNPLHFLRMSSKAAVVDMTVKTLRQTQRVSGLLDELYLRQNIWYKLLIR